MILIISGTNRKNSNSFKLAQEYQKNLNNKSVKSEILSLENLPESFIQTALYENNGKNEEFNLIRNQIDNYNKFVFIVSEYNGSLPGILKLFLDGLKYPGSLKNKKAALVGLSAGPQGGTLALSHLTDILNYLGTHVLANRIKLPFIDKNMENGFLKEGSYKEHLISQSQQIIDF